MPARLNPRHSDMVRQKIQASCLIHRLQQCAMGEVELTPTQVNAINSLLDRSVPKLSQIQHTGDPDNPVHTDNKWTVELVRAEPKTT
jgi:hypothetical protein